MRCKRVFYIDTFLYFYLVFLYIIKELVSTIQADREFVEVWQMCNDFYTTELPTQRFKSFLLEVEVIFCCCFFWDVGRRGFWEMNCMKQMVARGETVEEVILTLAEVPTLKTSDTEDTWISYRGMTSVSLLWTTYSMTHLRKLTHFLSSLFYLLTPLTLLPLTLI